VSEEARRVRSELAGSGEHASATQDVVSGEARRVRSELAGSGEPASATQSYWFDNHCHLQSFDDPAGAIADAAASGVTQLMCVGTDLETSRRAVELAAQFPDSVRATVGLHPHDASRLEAEAPALAELFTAAGVAAVGEAGFDLRYLHSTIEEQARAFRWQIRVAHAFDLPLVIHTREAWDETFAVLDEEGMPRRTVMHCFTGGEAEAAASIARGASLSFSGIVSFKSARDVRAAAASAPADRIMVETDAPYLSPVPHRGEPNRPAWVPIVGAALAAARGSDVDEIRALTCTNATDFYAISTDTSAMPPSLPNR
jgi:TatD DNase family protein